MATRPGGRWSWGCGLCFSGRAGHARPLRANGVFGIVGPAQWILVDIGADPIEFVFIPHNTFPVIPLPNGGTGLFTGC